MLKAAKFNY